MTTYTITVPMTLTKHDIDDIMTTAIESGYAWHRGGGPNADGSGWIIAMEDIDAETENATVTKALNYLDLAHIIGTWVTNERTLRFDDELAHNIDVNDADCIVQHAFYGDIIFA